MSNKLDKFVKSRIHQVLVPPEAGLSFIFKVSVIKVGKLCPKPKTNHESPKRRKHEKRTREKDVSCFPPFVFS